MKMRLKDGKLKVLTLSYDDGVVQDIRLLEIMNKYGLKGTFNLNSNWYLPEDVERKEKKQRRMKLSEAQEILGKSGQEIAIHAYNHPHLENMDTSEIIYEIIEDRRAMEKDYGRIVRGMAYPYGTYNQKVVDVLEKCRVAYARTVVTTCSFKFPENWLTLHPTCHHNNARLEELIQKFVEVPNRFGDAEMFYLWGHSYEFDDNDNWEVIEKFAEYAGRHEHIWYATNIEVYEYVMAYERLETSYDKKIIHNPSAIDVWVDINGETYCIKAGETLYL